MCGRYFLDTLPEFLIKRLSIRKVEPFAPRYNITPSQDVLVARAIGDAYELASLRWGLIPFWAKDEKIGNRMINARSETVSEKPAFRAAWKKRRAVVPAAGFYEWHRSGDTKQPYAIRANDHQPFAIAALWEHWDKGPEPVESVALLTMQANQQIAPIHHRMPVVIQEPDLQQWLSGSTTEAAECLSRAKTVSFDFQAISTRVNRPQNDDPSVLEPLPSDDESVNDQ